MQGWINSLRPETKYPLICNVAWNVNPLTAQNAWRHNQVIVSILAADALALKHRVIDIHNADAMSVAQCEFQKECLTHWGRVTHICVSNLTIIGSDNGLLPSQRQAIIWTNAGILLIGTLGTNFSEILIEIHTFSNKKMHLQLSSGKCRPFCLCLNELRCEYLRDARFNLKVAQFS